MHLETVLEAMATAKRHGIVVRQLEVSGFYARLNQRDQRLRSKVSSGLSNVTTLRIIDSSHLMSFMSKTYLPCLRYVEIKDCWMTTEDIHGFLIDEPRVQSLQLENIWLPECLRIESSGISIPAGKHQVRRIEKGIIVAKAEANTLEG